MIHKVPRALASACSLTSSSVCLVSSYTVLSQASPVCSYYSLQAADMCSAVAGEGVVLYIVECLVASLGSTQ